MRSVGAQDGDIADADAGKRDANALLDDGVGLPSVFVDIEQGCDETLNLA
jgi:hypothetical protein